MITKMDRSEILWGSIYYVLSYFLLPYLFSFLGILLPIPQWLCQVALFFSNFLFTLLIFRRFLLKSLKTALGSPGRFFGYTALGFVFYYTANFVIVYLITLLRPDFTNLNDSTIVSLAQDGGIWIAASAVVLVPVAEETLFRGLFFNAFGKKHPIGAWFLSAGVFSAIHIVGYIGSYDVFSFALAFIQYLPAGFCLAYAYKASGTILAPIFMHTVINLIGVMILL